MHVCDNNFFMLNLNSLNISLHTRVSTRLSRAHTHARMHARMLCRAVGVPVKRQQTISVIIEILH